MSTIRGTIRDGKVVLDEPANWPEGTRVQIELTDPQVVEPVPGDEDDSPEAIEHRLALMDRFDAWMTEEELAAWERVRAENKAFQLSQREKWCREAEQPWQ